MIGSSILCLALNIFHEARGESIKDQIAVAAITLNRVEDKESPNSICKVVYEPSAFSWTLSKKKRKLKHESQLKNKEEKAAFMKAKEIAHLYIQGMLPNPIGKRKYFNNKHLGKRYETPYKPIRFSKLVYY